MKKQKQESLIGKLDKEQQIQRAFHEKNVFDNGKYQWKKQVEREYERKIREQMTLQQKQQQSAIVIQKYARGLISRSRNLDEIIQLRQKTTSTLIEDLYFTSLNCFYHGGSLPIRSANFIKEKWKRYKFYCKILRIKQVSDYYAKKRRKYSKILIKAVFAQRIDLWRIEEVKFERMKNFKLLQIRQRLSILTIRKFWKKKRLNANVLRGKIRRYKRRKQQNQRKSPNRRTLRPQKLDQSKVINEQSSDATYEPSIQKAQSQASEIEQFVLDYDQEHQNSDDQNTSEVENTEQNQQALLHLSDDEEERIKKYNEQRQQVIQQGIISYNIPKPRRLQLSSCLNDKEIDSNCLSPTENQLNYSKNAIRNFSHSNERVISRKPPRRIKQEYEYSEYSDDEDYQRHYMRPTVASKIQRHDFEQFLEELNPTYEIIKFTKKRMNSLMDVHTFSSKQKVSQRKYFEQFEKPAWRPIARTAPRFQSMAPQLEPIRSRKVPAKLAPPAKLQPISVNLSQESVQTAVTVQQERPVFSSLSFEEALPDISELLRRYKKTDQRFKLQETPLEIKASKCRSTLPRIR